MKSILMFMMVLGFALSASAHKKSTKARAVVENEKCGVLLGLSNGTWGLPGGAIEKGESSKDAALREIREETGLQGKEIIEVSLLGVNKALRSNIYLVRVTDHACESVTHFDDPDKEFSELKWFAPTDLPKNIYSDVVEHIAWFLKQSYSAKVDL